MFGAQKLHQPKDREWLSDAAEAIIFVVIAGGLMLVFYELMFGCLHQWLLA